MFLYNLSKTSPTKAAFLCGYEVFRNYWPSPAAEPRQPHRRRRCWPPGPRPPRGRTSAAAKGSGGAQQKWLLVAGGGGIYTSEYNMPTKKQFFNPEKVQKGCAQWNNGTMADSDGKGGAIRTIWSRRRQWASFEPTIDPGQSHSSLACHDNGN